MTLTIKTITIKNNQTDFDFKVQQESNKDSGDYDLKGICFSTSMDDAKNIYYSALIIKEIR